MLNKEEELRLAVIAKRIENESIGQVMPEYTLDEFYLDLRWLVEKFKETNEELKELPCRGSENSCFRAVPEVYKNPKNEISDRFYPR